MNFCNKGILRLAALFQNDKSKAGPSLAFPRAGKNARDPRSLWMTPKSLGRRNGVAVVADVGFGDTAVVHSDVDRRGGNFDAGASFFVSFHQQALANVAMLDVHGERDLGGGVAEIFYSHCGEKPAMQDGARVNRIHFEIR